MSEAGYHCPINLPTADPYTPYLRVLSRSFDADGFERGERINGFTECPKCGRWWPNVEEPDCWEEGEDAGHETIWLATGWWGSSICEECDLLMIEQPDGTSEVYRLGNVNA